MTFPNIAAYFRQTRPSSPQNIYWRTVPVRRLTPLLLAIFCMFGMVGCFVDLLAYGQKPFLTVIVWSLFSGFIAVVWILAYFRDRRWLIGAVVLWFAGSRGLSLLLHHFGPYDHPSPQRGTIAATVACMALSLLACVFFMNFIQKEGRRAIRMQTELSIAQGIQQTLVPVIDHRSAGLEIYGASLPSAEVGGDLVDLVPLPDGTLFAYVADVSGHGLPAGILMGMIKTAVRTQLFDLPSPTAVFERLNEVLPAVKEAHMYATCTALRIRPHQAGGCKVDYAIAGQPAMLHATANGVERLHDAQLPLGLLAGPPYAGHAVEMHRGDVLLVATDGILEATDASGAEFGLDRLATILRDHATEPLNGIAAKIHITLSASFKQHDDQSLLLLRLSA